MLRAAASAAVCLTILLLISTGNILYGATTLAGPSKGERPVTVRVESCQRTGPVSRSGFWWTCQVTLGSAGDPSSAVIGRSIVTRAHIGHDVTVQENCNDTGRHHGPTVSSWWSVPMALLFVGGSGLVWMAGWFTIMFLFGWCPIPGEGSGAEAEREGQDRHRDIVRNGRWQLAKTLCRRHMPTDP